MIGKLVLAIIGIVVLLIIFSPAKAPSSTASAPREPGNIDAQVMCQQFIEKQLKAPSTAKFPSSREWKIDHVAGTADYHASSYVDAQNSFGAMIRSNITCDMTYDASTKLWTASKASID